MVQEEKAAFAFPTRSWNAAAEQGYIASYLPEEYGGMGYDLTTHYLIFEELCRNGYPCCGAIAGHILAILAIEHWGTEEQKKLFLPDVGSGKKMACGSVSDPAGMTNFSEWGFTEEETEDGWILNGIKVITTNAAHADVKVIFAPPSPGSKWLDHVYVIPTETPGVEPGEQEKKLVPDGSDWGTLKLNNVKVPKICRLDDNGAGDDWLGASFMMVAIEALVFGDKGFKMAFDYANQRSRAGKKLTSLQKVSHNLADMAIRNTASRTLIYTAARLWDEGRTGECKRLASMAKTYVCEAANKTLHDAVVIYGGIGCTMPAIIGLLWAASIQLEIAEMPCDVHRDLVIETYGVELDWK
jgi:alkylation response protein AidB-like acyl-CoA dehydrogenase